MASGIIEELSFPFNGPNRLWDGVDFANYFGLFIGNGIFPNPSNNLKVETLYNSFVLTVRKGTAFLNGCGFIRFKDKDLIIEPADNVNRRIDTICIRLNYLERVIELIVHKGVASAIPVATPLVRTGDFWEAKIAEITITPASVIITAGNIKDTRLDPTVCGLVSALIESVDTEYHFTQIQARLDELMVEWGYAEDVVREQRDRTLALIGALETQSFLIFDNNFDNISNKPGVRITTLWEENKKTEEMILIANDNLVARRITEYLDDVRKSTVSFFDNSFNVNGNTFTSTNSVRIETKAWETMERIVL